MNDIALTPEYLEHLLALGKAVPAGPWGTCLNATELFGRYFPDWGTIYANVERRGGVLEGCIIATTNRNFISDEERAAAWEKDKTGEKVDPGLSGKLAAYIAAYHPGVTTALIMEILRLRGEVERLGTIVTGYQVSTEEAQEIMGELRAENERLGEDFDAAARSAADESMKAVSLEEEADWLAALLANICKSGRGCPAEGSLQCDPLECGWMEASHWRNKAREAVEKAHEYE